MVQAKAVKPSHLQQLWRSLHDEAKEKFPNAPLGSKAETHMDVMQLSQRLMGATDPRCLYATHSALLRDRKYFYRLKTRPPTYHPRDEQQILKMQAQQDFVRDRMPCVCITLVMLARHSLAVLATLRVLM
jgi:hypothetical protein